VLRVGTALIACLVAVAVSGCGSGSGSTSKQANGAQTQGVATCGAISGYVAELHGVTCQTVNVTIALLEGRALHQTVTIADHPRGKRVARVSWVCNSSRPIVGPTTCRDGHRSFTVEHDPRLARAAADR
jgi:hypothetical protein